MKTIRNRDELNQRDLQNINESLVKFDNYIQRATKQPTDENIGLYERWIDCMYDIQKIVVVDTDSLQASVLNEGSKQIPKKIKIEQYMYTKCDCGHEFSVHHGDGYYSVPCHNKTNYCPDCGQRLLWE